MDGPERAANNEAEDAPAEEAKGHCLLATYAIHEEATNYTAGEVEAVHHGLGSDGQQSGGDELHAASERHIENRPEEEEPTP